MYIYICPLYILACMGLAYNVEHLLLLSLICRLIGLYYLFFQKSGLNIFPTSFGYKILPLFCITLYSHVNWIDVFRLSTKHVRGHSSSDKPPCANVILSCANVILSCANVMLSCANVVLHVRTWCSTWERSIYHVRTC